MSASDLTFRFNDGDAYDRYMGVWSRAACPAFLSWLGAPRDATWLDVGCGTGALTAAILDSQEPASVMAIDPAAAQVDTARRRFTSTRVRFEVADACALPCTDGTLDVVASALVVNFIPDRAKAVAEMNRVLRAGGLVAAFVWDFAVDRSPSGPVRRALTALGTPPPPVPGTADSRLPQFGALFASAGFVELQTRVIDVALDFEDATAFWIAQSTGFSPVARFVKGLSEDQRREAQRMVEAELETLPGGGARYTARANAVKARKR
jgi:ubiquinone/menaquinone biosynthesis C-methylase UbiE